MRTRVRVATPRDDAALRALTASVAMPGAVTIAFAREPSYFLASTVLGEEAVVLVGERDGAVVGVACRAERSVLLSGRQERVWTVGHLRIAPEARDRTLLVQGARWLRERERVGSIGFALIARENPRAREALIGARPPAGLRVARVDGVTTHALLLRPTRARGVPGVDLRPARTSDESALCAFWLREGARRHFFPVTAPGDVGGPSLRGLHLRDVITAWQAERLVGTIAVWDQRAFAQEVVVGYGPALARARPLYDLAARAIGAAPLTPPGAAIALVSAARLCVAGDDPRLANALVSAAKARAHALGAAFLMVAACDRDPLRRVIRRHLHVPYRSDLVALSWNADPSAALDDRAAYVEIAAT